MQSAPRFFTTSLATLALSFGIASAGAVSAQAQEDAAPQKVVQLTSMADYKNLINTADKPVLVDFYAAWCGYCKQLSPVLDKFAERRSDVIVAKIDADRVRSVGDLERIKGYPTVKLFVGGKAVHTSFIPASEDALDAFVKKGVSVAAKAPKP